jgi:hypothetical protein
MPPKFEGMWMIAIEQGATAEAAPDAPDEPERDPSGPE